MYMYLKITYLSECVSLLPISEIGGRKNTFSNGGMSIVIVRVGGVVLINDDNKPRGFWRVGCVKSLIDGHTRGAILTITLPGEKIITLKRPLQRLYSIEVKADTRNTESELDDVSEVRPMIDRPRGVVAVEARDRCKAKARDRCKAIALHKQKHEP